jgi:drug/metabolite transporter (DMT)-like permease
MLLLVITSIVSSGFGLLVRYSQRRGCNLFAVGAVNYISASLFHGVLVLAFGLPSLHAPTIWIGALGGISYSLTYMLFLRFMSLRGLSITAVIMRMSVVVPLFFALVVWGEEASSIQLIGALITLLSLPFLALPPTQPASRIPARSILLLIALFFGVGTCALCIRGYHQTGVRGEENFFFTVLFGTAALVMIAAWLFGREQTRVKDIPYGMAVGLSNALHNRLLIACLQILPSILVYPFFTTVGLISTILVCWLLWGERINPREMIGTVIATLGIVLINLSAS